MEPSVVNGAACNKNNLENVCVACRLYLLEISRLCFREHFNLKSDFPPYEINLVDSAISEL